MVDATARALVYSVMDRLRFLRPVVPKPLRRAAFNVVANRGIERLASRRFLRAAILPAVAEAGHRRMLFVGTQSYNLALFRDCEARGLAVWSIDVDAYAARWGAPHGHFTGDIRRIDSIAAAQSFDVVVLNGILGFGIDTEQDAAATLRALAGVAAPGALLIVGWNPGRTEDREIDMFRRGLEAVSLGSLGQCREFPPQRPLEGHPHRYEFFHLREPVS